MFEVTGEPMPPGIWLRLADGTEWKLKGIAVSPHPQGVHETQMEFLLRGVREQYPGATVIFKEAP